MTKKKAARRGRKPATSSEVATPASPEPTAETEEKSSVPSFEQLGLIPEVVSSVREAGYTSPTPIQQQAIPIALKGRDLIGLAQTGTGKSAGFTLPIVHRLHGGPRRTRALVLTPTRELCMQVE